MDDATSRPTELHYRCAHCRVPRFLAAASRGLVGTLRIKCPKCRTESIFDLATGALLPTKPLRAQERELRCGGCQWFQAGIHVTQGHGHVRVQCPRIDANGERCRRSNHFVVEAGSDAPVLELPVG